MASAARRPEGVLRSLRGGNERNITKSLIDRGSGRMTPKQEVGLFRVKETGHPDDEMWIDPR